MPPALLLDENLSERLVSLLAPDYPGARHVRLLGLGGATDETLWEYARERGLLLVTRDEDFVRLSVLRGPPPQVVWLDVGNAPTRAIADLLRVQIAALELFSTDAEAGFLRLRLVEPPG